MSNSSARFWLLPNARALHAIGIGTSLVASLAYADVGAWRPERLTPFTEYRDTSASLDESTFRRGARSLFGAETKGTDSELPFDQHSNVCFTPITYCYLPAHYPVGSPCWCATPYGPSQGYVR